MIKRTDEVHEIDDEVSTKRSIRFVSESSDQNQSNEKMDVDMPDEGEITYNESGNFGTVIFIQGIPSNRKQYLSEFSVFFIEIIIN